MRNGIFSPLLIIYMSEVTVPHELGIVDHEAVTRLDLPAMPELNDLQSAWNAEGRHYEERQGEIEVNGQKYEFRVSFVNVKCRGLKDSAFPYGMRRVLTEVAPNLEAPHDIVIPVLPGWGETSAQFEGDFLNLLLEVLKDAGYENPKIIGVNTSGRGTPEYLNEKNRNRISGIGFEDEINDAQNIADALRGRGYFYKPGTDPEKKPPVAVIGHSMGALNASAFINIMNKGGGIPSTGHKNTGLRIEKLLHMMPAADGVLTMLRPKFVWAVRDQILESVIQAVHGKGALELNEEAYHRIMFGDKDFRDLEQYDRSVPDSARRFLQMTFNLRRMFADVYRYGGSAEGVDMTVWQGGKDNLIPDSAIKDLPRLVEEGGAGNGKVKTETLSDLSHSFPFRLRDAQREQVQAALKRFVGEKVDFS